MPTTGAYGPSSTGRTLPDAALDLLAEHGDTEVEPMSVGIETSCGLLVAVLRTGT
ncbi:hypothetical protein [Streptomyces xylophagus]|uniref:hypothetical protein n=1 Tax=Streptomyces xylophagus TaxID=285514 RepID=UPI000A40E2FF|nr:hypothetical protein [Streptomyces xylophagus]